MKTVEIKSEATIAVPNQHWQPVLNALSRYHRERYQDWVDCFITDTNRCPLPDLCRK